MMPAMKALRTPDERFQGLPDFPFEPHYVDDLRGFEGLRLHYLDEGDPGSDQVFLCLHGEPSWAFLYRKFVPVFARAGRVIAPDFFGFGRSDKPVEDNVYTYGFHRATLVAFLDRLNLKRVTLVCQDWGGILGLGLPVDRPDLIEGLFVMNTALPTGHEAPSEGFIAWRDFVASQSDLDVGRLMGRAVPGLSDAERAAYDAPFVDASYKAGVRRFPAIVPIRPEMEGASIGVAATEFWSKQWSGKAFMAIGMQDPVLGPAVMRALAKTIANLPEPFEVPDGGHFVQESGASLADRALKVLAG